jgi:hypothetical protein
MGCGCRKSCRELFKELNILPLSSQYIFSLLLFVFNNTDYFVSNSVFHSCTTRQRNDLHLPQVTLAMYQKGVCYSGIKICKGLSKAIKDIYSNLISLKLIEITFFIHIHYYTLDEFFLTNGNILFLLCLYYRFFLHCTIIFIFSILTNYPLFFYFKLIFKLCITVFICFFSLYICIPYFIFLRICNLYLFVFAYFNL